MNVHVRLLALLASFAWMVTLRPDIWFCGDFETGGLQGWTWDRARRESIQVVTRPVRKGRYAVRMTLVPGDIAALKERAELKVGNKEIERTHGRQGGEMWYGWSLLVPEDYADPPGERFQIVGQWHHRPARAELPGQTGPVARGERLPPLVLHLSPKGGRHVLTLIGRGSPNADGRRLGTRPVRRGVWLDLLFHIRWSTGRDGFVEAWLDGRPFTPGKMHGPTLYSPVTNYLRLGLYRGKGFTTTNSVYYDEVRIGGSRQAVIP